MKYERPHIRSSQVVKFTSQNSKWGLCLYNIYNNKKIKGNIVMRKRKKIKIQTLIFLGNFNGPNLE